MKRITSASALAMGVVSFAACSSGPMDPAPQSGRPSLMLFGAVGAPTAAAPTATPDACAPVVTDDGPIFSSTSTYIVAYTVPAGCTPTDATPAAPSAADSIVLRLTFPPG